MLPELPWARPAKKKSRIPEMRLNVLKQERELLLLELLVLVLEFIDSPCSIYQLGFTSVVGM